MHNIIVAWVNDPDRFETHVPLKFIGERNQRLHYGNDIKVVFLNGLSLLSENYRQDLGNLGYTLIDASMHYDLLVESFKQLDRFGDYEKKCFLRWLVIKKLFPGQPFIHYDGDIVLNESLEKIASLAAGLTFVLYGCPAFTVLSDHSWLDIYEAELKKFVLDIDSYSKQAWLDRNGWEATFLTKASGSRFRKVITSDQDFISHLIHTEQLPQASTATVHGRFNDYMLIQNPIIFNFYSPFIPYTYERIDDVDYFTHKRIDDPSEQHYKKRMLFWHMQSCFNFYLARARVRQSVPLGKFFRVHYTNEKKLFDVTLNKYINRYLGHASRLAVYKYYFGKHNFSSIMNAWAWHVKGVFGR